jgi:hypothetical protein
MPEELGLEPTGTTIRIAVPFPPPCSTCRHRVVSGHDMYCIKIFRDTPDDGHCHLHETKETQ